MIKWLFVFATLFISNPSIVQSSELSKDDLVEATVHSCHDGDTCRIALNSKNKNNSVWFNARLFGIDCQEMTTADRQHLQPHAITATQHINNMLSQKTVFVRQSEIDRYNRPIIEIYLDHETGLQNINLKMVLDAHCEAYKGTVRGISLALYHAAETDAKQRKLGIWALENYISPAEFRKSKSK